MRPPMEPKMSVQSNTYVMCGVLRPLLAQRRRPRGA